MTSPNSTPRYLVGQVPCNMLLNRVRPSIFMSGWMISWSIVSTLMALVQGYKGMLACRFVLGITEAPFYPGGLYLISQFYTRKESATRMSVFYSRSGSSKTHVFFLTSFKLETYSLVPSLA